MPSGRPPQPASRNVTSCRQELAGRPVTAVPHQRQRQPAAPPSGDVGEPDRPGAARNDWVAPDNSTTPASTGAHTPSPPRERPSRYVPPVRPWPGPTTASATAASNCQGRQPTASHRQPADRIHHEVMHDTNCDSAEAPADRHDQSSPHGREHQRPAPIPLRDRTLSRNRPAASPTRNTAPAGRRPRQKRRQQRRPQQQLAHRRAASSHRSQAATPPRFSNLLSSLEDDSETFAKEEIRS